MSGDAMPQAAAPSTLTPTPEPTSEPTPGSIRAEWRRRRPKAIPIPGDQAARQGAVSRLAFQLLGRERAIEFLNAAHEGLGGRPLALATASAAGLAEVEAELGRMNYRESGETAAAAPLTLAHRS